MWRYELSIIIVNWNTKDLINNCLKSIYDNTKDLNYEIIVVDNNSSDESVALMKENFLKHSNFRLIENKFNKGFASANNQAIQVSNGSTVLLLNPDTKIIGNVIKDTHKYLNKERTVGIAGCKVLNPDESLQLACRRMIPTPKDAFFKLFGFSKIFKNSKKITRYNVTYASEDEFIDVDSVSGCFLMIKREVIDMIGLLDDTFFMYGEEMDWCLRAKKAGYIVRYCPVGAIIHYKGESSRQLGTKATYEFYRAMFLFYNKNNKSENNIVINFVVFIGIFLLGLLAVIKSIILPNSRVGTKG